MGHCWTLLWAVASISIIGTGAVCARHPLGQKSGKWEPPSDGCRMDTNDPKQKFGGGGRGSVSLGPLSRLSDHPLGSLMEARNQH